MNHPSESSVVDSRSDALDTLDQVQTERGIRLRALIIGIILIPLNVYWVIASELRWYVILTINPLFVTPIFYLFMMVGLNALLRRINHKLAFRPGELVVVYMMMVVSCTVATHDFLINLMSSLGWVRWFATPENGWESTMFPHLPKWLFVWDKELLKGYFNGNANLYDPRVLRMFLAPLGFWSIFIFTIGWMFFCMNVLLRKAWMDHTKLTFPIVRLPLAMTGEPSDENIMLSRALWIGFAIAAILSITNGLYEYFPNMPHLQVRARWFTFQTAPWLSINPLPLTLYPFAIGLSFLMPLDVSFSCWFFYLFIKAQTIIGYQLGYSTMQDFPFMTEQQIGAWMTFGVLLIYASRHHFHTIIKTALGPPDGTDSDEPISYRVAFWGLITGMVVFFIFWWQAGMSPVWAMVVMVMYLLLSLTITRVRAESGAQHTVWDLEPKNLFRLFDSDMLGPANLAAAAASHWYWRLNRSHTMPSQMEAFKLAKEHKVDLRALKLPLLLGLVLATVFGMWACLHVLYKEGALAKCVGFPLGPGYESFNWLGTALNPGFKAQPGRWIALGSAIGLTCLLTWMRSRFPWFPFHPLGYCVGPWSMWLWFPFFIAWLVKLLVLRYGGLRFYKKTIPFFLGLILGDYVCGATWSLIAVTCHIPVTQVFH